MDITHAIGGYCKKLRELAAEKAQLARAIELQRAELCTLEKEVKERKQRLAELEGSLMALRVTDMEAEEMVVEQQSKDVHMRWAAMTGKAAKAVWDTLDTCTTAEKVKIMEHARACFLDHINAGWDIQLAILSKPKSSVEERD
ncbi:hypothetical protein QJQ45_007697 [Haematococcus lacustris]|nr:hypothetical protein QJQ45_007697 [Haematococcus lacustris]